MIVRDEAAVIERCLNSVRRVIDSWQICDTGSRDRTRELVAESLADLPGRLYERPWRDFGWNRSELMELARGSADYLLLLDADMTLRHEAPLPQLTADAYCLRSAGGLDYAVPRLVRGDRRWWFEGATHEFLATEGDYTQAELPHLMVVHHGDGGRRSEKFERDRRLLERTLQEDPDNARAAFYLAQTLADLGEHDAAAALYLRRAELGGWDEEVFYALYMAGALLGRRDPERGMPILLSAWETRPSRAEPLHELARICRFAGWHRAARSFAEQGLQIPYPEDRLFVHRWIYEWGLRYELALSAFETGEAELALPAAEELLDHPDLPEDIKLFVTERLRASGHSSPGAPSLGSLIDEAEFAELCLDVLPAWPTFNATIAADGTGFRLIVRSANYRLEAGAYHFLTEDPVVQSHNYLLRLDEDLEVVDVTALLQPSDRSVAGARVLGYEDCRLIEVDSRWYASATVRDRDPDGLCQIALIQLDGSRVESETLLRAPVPGRHEKNWMPFISGSELCFVYACGPTIVLTCDPDTGRTEVVSDQPGPPRADRLRGGSQGVPVGDGFLFVVHESEDCGGTRRYCHRFILIDDQHRLTAMSRSFTLSGQPVEFVAGLAARGSDLLLSFGVNDASAWLARVPISAVLGLLDPVSGFDPRAALKASS